MTNAGLTSAPPQAWSVDLATLDEATLVARARDRDVGSFEALVRRYERRIYALCLRMLGGSRAEAQDVAQEVFLTVWRRLPELEADDAFGAWVYRTATNRCFNVLRRDRRTAELDDDLTPVPSTGGNTDDAVRAAVPLAVGRPVTAVRVHIVDVDLSVDRR